MSYMSDPLGYSLDMHITGHYGMDQFRDEIALEEICDQCPVQNDPETCIYDPDGCASLDALLKCPILKYMIEQAYLNDCIMDAVMFEQYRDELREKGQDIDPVSGEKIWL